MGKVVDITEKLDFDTNPKLVIKGKEYEVNADAETVLKIMGVLSAEGTSPEAVIKMYDLLFSEKERKTIAKLGLQFKDFQKVIEAAINLVTGSEEEEQGE